MRLGGLLVAGVVSIGVAGCGVQTTNGAKRSLLGVSERQLLIDAQHVLAAEGLEVASFDAKKGEMTTEWETRARRQLQYVVAVTDRAMGAAETSPKADDTDAASSPGRVPRSVTLNVAVKQRDKTVKGWGTPYPASAKKAEDLADDIVELSVRRFNHGIQMSTDLPIEETDEPPTEKAPTCEATAGCDAGFHCAGGRCVAECTADMTCPGSEQCDPRGRCVSKPAPCPEPAEAVSGGQVDDELPYDLEDDKADRKKSDSDNRQEKKASRFKRTEGADGGKATEGKVSDAK